MILSLKSGIGNDITIPGKLQSYLMAGIPIVGSINGETNTIVNQHNLGKCADAKDQDLLIKNIKELININQAQYNMMVNNCINYYDKNFDILNCLKILKGIINE
jgi:glycosyltransferase involved in cell wall biosynthesis